MTAHLPEEYLLISGYIGIDHLLDLVEVQNQLGAFQKPLERGPDAGLIFGTALSHVFLPDRA